MPPVTAQYWPWGCSITTIDPVPDGSDAAYSPTWSTQCVPGGKPCLWGFSVAIDGGLAALARNLNVVAGAAILGVISFRPVMGENGTVGSVSLNGEKKQ